MSVSDTIEISGLKVDTIVGVRGWERQVRQPVEIDLVIFTDLTAAGASDDLNDTVDYGSLARRVSEMVADSEFQLVEALAESVTTLILTEFPVHRVKLRLRKPHAITTADHVAIEIERPHL